MILSRSSTIRWYVRVPFERDRFRLMSVYESPGWTRTYPRIMPRVWCSSTSFRFRRTYSGNRTSPNADARPASVVPTSAAARARTPARISTPFGSGVTAIPTVSSPMRPSGSATTRVTWNRPCRGKATDALLPTRTGTNRPSSSLILHSYRAMSPVDRVPSRVTTSPALTTALATAFATGGVASGGGLVVDRVGRGGGGWFPGSLPSFATARNVIAYSVRSLSASWAIVSTSAPPLADQVIVTPPTPGDRRNASSNEGRATRPGKVKDI